jgi:vacuolar-type H+-ATPase subunit E/Vma4
MKKRRRSRHNPCPPPWYIPRPVVIEDEYEQQIQRATAKLERAYAKAQRRAEQAEERLRRAKVRRGIKKHVIAELQALLEVRRAELAEYERMMVASPASAVHRGIKSYRPVPQREVAS